MSRRRRGLPGSHDGPGQRSSLPAAAALPQRPVRLDVTGLGQSGEGVGRVDGVATFVPGAIPGDVIEAEIVSAGRGRMYRGRLLHIFEPSPDRVEPPCAVAAVCGGCQLQHMDYAAQLRAKTQQVRDALQRIGKLDPGLVRDCIGMSDPWHYRNKAQFPVGVAAGGELVAGLFRRGTHEIVDLDDCLIQHPLNDAILATGKQLLCEFGLAPYDELAHTGLVRHIFARTGVRTGEGMAVLVTRERRLPHARALAEAWLERVPGLVGVLQNVNPERTNVVLGQETRLLAGREYIEDRIGDLRFRISVRSFFQVNTEQTERLYSIARELAELRPGDRVIDAYCGIGTITLFFAEQAAHVHGIEVVPEAVADARANAALNGVENVTFTAGRVEDVGPALVAAGEAADVIVVDPPRKGCEPEVLAAFAEMQPRRIVYVSCNPATLARDLAILSRRGYRTEVVQPVDMFPHTAHVESVTSMVREE